MFPANQGFCTNHFSRIQVSLGLVVHYELAACQGFTHTLQVQSVRLNLMVVLRIKEVVGVFPSLFGQIHGLIRMAQEGIGIHIVVGVQADPDAGRNGYELVLNFQRLLHDGEHAIECESALLRLPQLREQQDKLVTTQPGQSVVGT